MNTNMQNLPNYRIYDRTGSGVTHDICAANDDAAIEAGREWIEGGDWAADSCHDDNDVIARVRTIELECEVGEIIYRPNRTAEVVAVLGGLGYEAKYLTIDGDAMRIPLCAGAAEIDALIDAEIERIEAVLPDGTEIEAGDIDGVMGQAGLESACQLRISWPPTDEIDEDATDAADRHDCSGSYSDPDPDCPCSEGWDFVSTVDAGLDQWGVRGHGGTRMTHYEVCRNTGIYRDTMRPGCQRNPDEPLEVVTYRDRDEDSEAYVVQHHADEDGFIPEWLAEYFGRSPSARMTKEDAEKWIAEHTDEDELDEDDLEHAFAAIYGHRADDEARAQGLWSHLCTSV